MKVIKSEWRIQKVIKHSQDKNLYLQQIRKIEIQFFWLSILEDLWLIKKDLSFFVKSSFLQSTL